MKARGDREDIVDFVERNVSEQELLSLFRGQQPERADFAAGVRDRVGEIERSAQASQSINAAAPGPRGTSPRASYWRKVAAIVPFASTTGATGAASGATLAKAFGGKWLPAAFLFPALIVGAIVGTFAVGARSIRRTAKESNTPAEVESQPARGTGLPWWVNAAPFVLLLAMMVGRGTFALDLIVVYLLVTMASLVYLVRQMSGIGALDRGGVARMAGGVLAMVVAVVVMQTAQLDISDGRSNWGMGPSGLVLVLGLIVVKAIEHGRVRRRELLFGLVFLVALNGLGITYSSPRALRSAVARIDLNPRDLSGWDGAAAVARALRACDFDVPERPDVRRELLDALRNGADIHPVVRSASIEMGLMTPDEWVELVGEPRAPRLDGEPRSLNTTFYYRHTESELLSSGALSVREAQFLADCYELSMPEPNDHGPLLDALRCVWAFDLLGQPHRVDALTPEIHGLLVRHWVSRSKAGWFFGRIGGFTSNPDKFDTSFHDDTLAGIELMCRVGVPEEIDPHLLRSFLRSAARAYTLIPGLQTSLHLESQAGLLLLERVIGLPERGFIAAVLAERLLLASVLTVALALFAIQSASVPGCRPEYCP